jgi:hypothetical protein
VTQSTDNSQQPITVDVKWIQLNHSIKAGLQSKLRADGILPYYVLPGTTKILYKRTDVEALIKSGFVASKGA